MRNLFKAILAKKLEMGIANIEEVEDSKAEKAEDKFARMFKRAI